MIKKIILPGIVLTMILLLQACYNDPEANFEFSYTSNFAPAMVTFTNLSSEADEFLWNFGDGESSTVESPVHTYFSAGTYNVSLTASGRGGSSLATKTLVIQGGQTRYKVKNATSDITLYRVTSYYWDGDNIVDDVDHGTMAPGNETNEVITERDVIDVAFKFEDSDEADWELVLYSYILEPYTLNTLILADTTSLWVEEKKSTSSLKIPKKDLTNFRILKIKDLK